MITSMDESQRGLGGTGLLHFLAGLGVENGHIFAVQGGVRTEGKPAVVAPLQIH